MSTVTRSLSVDATDGVALALHQWAQDGAGAAIFYIHGIQSHAGWLFETGPALARRGVSFFAADRRGSGRSGGMRGHLASSAQVFDDYLRCIARVRSLTGHLPLLVLGQSFGGSILAGLEASGPLRADALLFCAPALGQQRARHDHDRLVALRRRSGTALAPLSLEDGDYTGEERYLRFMAEDPLMLRSVTEATRATMVGIEDSYMEAREAPENAVATFVAIPEDDPIIDLAAAGRVIARRYPGHVARRFATSWHYLEFTAIREAYWDWVAQCALRRGVQA